MRFYKVSHKIPAHGQKIKVILAEPVLAFKKPPPGCGMGATGTQGYPRYKDNIMYEIQVDEDIHLRPLEGHQAEALHWLVEENRAYLRQWMRWLDINVSVADNRNFIAQMRHQYADRSGLVQGLWFRGELAGVIGHNRIDWHSRRSEAGYWLGAKFQGQGIVTKSCKALLTHAFAELGLNRVEFRVATGNTRSRAIQLRLGCREEGTLRDADWLYDHFVDYVVYSMLAREWAAQGMPSG